MEQSEEHRRSALSLLIDRPVPLGEPKGRKKFRLNLEELKGGRPEEIERPESKPVNQNRQCMSIKFAAELSLAILATLPKQLSQINANHLIGLVQTATSKLFRMNLTSVRKR